MRLADSLLACARCRTKCGANDERYLQVSAACCLLDKAEWFLSGKHPALVLYLYSVIESWSEGWVESQRKVPLAAVVCLFERN